MLWQVVVIICAFAHFEKYGFNYAMTASAILQSFYIGKFFWWEDGYMQSIDIIVDRAGRFNERDCFTVSMLAVAIRTIHSSPTGVISPRLPH